jgi:formate hydrogenlyase transcriptional activator
LENFIERSVILSEGSVLEVPIAELQPQAEPELATLESMGTEYVLRALRECDGVVEGPNGAAVRIGVSAATLHSMMRKLKIPR